MDPVKLAQLMCSKLCHDLITPVGAISTGLEIITDSKNDIDPELLALTAQSSQNASQRLVYYRAAFGYSGFNILKTPSQIKVLLRDYLDTYKVKLDWQCNIGTDMEMSGLLQDHARILVNIVGIMAECAPYAGSLTIKIHPIQNEKSLAFSIALTGDLVNMRPENKKALMGELMDEDVKPQNVQSQLTYRFIEMKNAELSLDNASSEALEITLRTENKDAQQYGSLF